jgi:WD40 repeat protein/serine/threonine protein kinase
MSAKQLDDSDELSLAAEIEVDELCLRFEAAWKAGQRPAIEDYLAGSCGEERLALLRELLLLDLFYRRRDKEHPRAEDYLARFPNLQSSWTEIDRLSNPSLIPVDSDTLTVPTTAHGKQGKRSVSLANYDQIELLGQGGMGVVYRARQVRLNRIVVLKMIRAGEEVGPDQLERFRTEAEVIAQIRHPNIVQIYEVGEHQGQPFLSLEYCGEGNLRDRLNGAPLPPREAAELLETLARAIQAAHSHQIIHRDLKPANVLFTGTRKEGQGTGRPGEASSLGPRLSSLVPKIGDFGLAKRLDEVGQTLSGAVMGTPAYMSPEQAAGDLKAVGVAADVYALGVILYECLTGRAPFRSATMIETLRQVAEDEPVPPRRLQPTCPRDLETICLKCLQKAPASRYPSAAALADDLGRFLRDEPITARPVGRIERLRSWCRRHPAQASAASLLIASLLLCVLGGIVLWRWQLEQTNRKNAEEARDLLAEEKHKTEKALAVAEKAQKEESRLRQELFNLSYSHRIGLAHEEWKTGRVKAASSLLDNTPKELRAWEWDYLHQLCHTEIRTFPGFDRGARGVAWSRDGKMIALAGADGLVRVYYTGSGLDAFCGKTPGTETWAVAFSPDSKVLAIAGNSGTVRLYETLIGFSIKELSGHEGMVTSLAFSPDGTMLACAVGTVTLSSVGSDSNNPASREVRLWDWKEAKLIHRLQGHARSLNAVAWSPDGRYVASGGWDSVVRIWDAKSGKPHKQLAGHTALIRGLAFSPNSEQLASSAEDGSVRLWDVPARLWEAATGSLLKVHEVSDSALDQVAYSPDGKLLACGCQDQLVHVLSAATGKPYRTLRGHSAWVTAAAFSPDGQSLVSAGMDGKGRIWDLTRDQEYRVLSGHRTWVYSTAFTPDGRLLATASGGVRLWDARTGILEGQLPVANEAVSIAISPDGKYLAGASKDGTIRIWDIKERKILNAWFSHGAKEARSVAFAPDGSFLASAGFDGQVQMWMVPEGKMIREMRGGSWGVAVSPNGKYIAGADNDQNVYLHDSTTGKLLHKLTGHEGPAVTVAFSPDSKHLASGSWDHTIRIWDVATGKEEKVLYVHSLGVLSLAYSPDGRRLVSASDDHRIKVLNAETGEELLTLTGHRGPVYSVSFSRDGRQLASGSWDHTAHIWRTDP